MKICETCRELLKETEIRDIPSGLCDKCYKKESSRIEDSTLKAFLFTIEIALVGTIIVSVLLYFSSGKEFEKPYFYIINFSTIGLLVSGLEVFYNEKLNRITRGYNSMRVLFPFAVFLGIELVLMLLVDAIEDLQPLAVYLFIAVFYWLLPKFFD